MMRRWWLTLAWLACLSTPSWALEPLRVDVRPGDTLYDLAERYLDDPAQWEVLARANGSPHPLRLPPGSTLLIPAELLRARPGAATVEHLSGTVQVRLGGEPARALTLDDRLVDGDVLETARNGFVTLRLADGALVRVAGDSELTLQRVGYAVRRQRADTQVELVRGRVESSVPTRAGARRHRFQVDTPLMSTGVRGTRFGVTAAAGLTSTDVDRGLVQTQAQGARGVRVAAGQGVSSRHPADAVPLLPAPDLAGVPALQTRPLIDVAFPAVPGAVAYRAYLAENATLDRVFDNAVFDAPRVRLEGWVDDHYVIAVRAIDANGIEGEAAIHAFELHARPEPPATLSPLPDAEVLVGPIAFSWTEADGIGAYDVELMGDTPHAAPRHAVRVQAPRTEVALAEPGRYQWRIRAVPADGSRPGPFSAPRDITVRAPVATQVAIAAGDDGLTLQWDGEPDQRFRVQIDTDERFTAPIAQFDLDVPRLQGVALPPGTLYLRVQATDADGFVRRYTTPQRFFVPRLVRHGDGMLITSDGSRVDSP